MGSKSPGVQSNRQALGFIFDEMETPNMGRGGGCQRFWAGCGAGGGGGDTKLVPGASHLTLSEGPPGSKAPMFSAAPSSVRAAGLPLSSTCTCPENLLLRTPSPAVIKGPQINETD